MLLFCYCIRKKCPHIQSHACCGVFTCVLHANIPSRISFIYSSTHSMHLIVVHRSWKKKNDWMLYWTPLLHVKHTIVTRRHAWNAKHWIRFTRNPIQLCKAFAILTYNSVALGGRVEKVRKGHFKAIWRIWSFCWIDISSQYGCCAKRAYMYI